MDPTSWPPPPPSEAFTCPRCGAPATARPEVQACSCGQRFLLVAGPFSDRALSPPEPDLAAESVTVRSSGSILRRFGRLTPTGLETGGLDPLFGRIPFATSLLAYRGVYSLTFWQRLPRGAAAVWLLGTLPLTVLALWASTELPPLLVLGVPMTLLLASSFWSIFVVRARYVRLVGANQTHVVRCDQPMRAGPRFRRELLRRCGHPPDLLA